MRAGRWAAVLALALGPLAAPVRADGRIAVHGRVLGPTGRGLAGARIELRPISSVYEQAVREIDGEDDAEPVAEASSRADGFFELRAPHDGLWRLDLAAGGYVPVRLSPFAVFTDGELPDVQLVPSLPLRVRVERPDGQPVAGARVRAVPAGSLSSPFEEAEGGWSSRERMARTGRDGEARLPAAAGERLVLWVAAPGFPVQKGPDAPGAQSSPVVVRLAAGVPALLRINELGRRRPAPAAVLLDEPSGLAVARVAPGGKAAVAAPGRGAWSVAVASADGRWGPFSIPARAAGPDAKTLRLLVPPAAVVTGRVVDAAGRTPLPGSLVWSRRDPSVAVRTDARGDYRLPGTRDTWEEVRGAAAGHFPAGASCLVGPGKTLCPTLLLAGSGELVGQVVDEAGDPVAGAEVRAILRAGEDAAIPGLSPGQPRPAYHTRSSPRGEVRFSTLWSGWPYDLRVSHPGFAPSEAPAQASLSGQPARPFRVVLLRGKTAAGRVEDEAGHPVSGAEVELKKSHVGGPLQPYLDDLPAPDDAIRHATTDADGKLTLSDLPGGSRFDVAIRRQGFAPFARQGVRLVETGDGPADLGTFVLETGSILEGRVTDGDGRPIAGAEVWSGDWIRTGFRAEPSPQVTGADGRFTLRDLSRGDAYLVICHLGYLPRSFSVSSAVSPPPFVLSPAARISGRAVDPDGHPVPGAQVAAQATGSVPSDLLMPGPPCGSGSDSFTSTDEEGRFTLELAAGSFDLRVQAAGYLSATSERRHTEPGQPLENVEIVLQRGAVLTGQVLEPDGTPVPNAHVRLDGSPPETWSDGDGSYRLSGASPGPDTVRADHPGHAPAAVEVDVEAAGENRLDLTLAPREQHEIRGTVLDPDGAPVAAARIQETVTGADGSFVLRRPDGRYRLRIEKEELAPAWAGVEVQGQEVEGVEIRLSAGATLAGKVLGLDPDHLRGAVIFAVGPGQDSAVPVEDDGSYRLEHLVPGRWALHVEDTDARGVAILAAEEEATLDLIAPPGAEPPERP